MLKKRVIALAAIVIVAGGGMYFWARSVLAQDAVREALGAQFADALGQPVSIQGIGVGLYPRVTVRLDGVRIGDPARAEVGTLHVGTALRALFSRRIEDASLLLEHARVELPLSLPALTSAGTEGDGGAPVELVSIGEIVMRDVQVVSGGRTLRGDVEIEASDRGLEIRKMRLSADDLSLEATGVITDMAGPVGELSVRAGEMNFDGLLRFVADFQGGSGLARAGAPTGAIPAGGTASGMNIDVALEADRGTLGDLVLDTLKGRARITPGEVRLEPVGFKVFDGTYEGALTLTLGATPGFHLSATLAGVDVGAATAFAGSPETITGRLSGRIDLTGRGLDAGNVMQSARGTVRVDIADGIVRNLGLVRAVVIATAMRAESGTRASLGGADEPFSTLGATLSVENGVARTTDLRFESEDLTVSAQGAIALDGDPVALDGRIQLSEQLTREGGTDLARYTQEQGRVTLPVTISGSAGDFLVRLDLGEMLQRALRNRAEEETKRVIERGLGGILR